MKDKIKWPTGNRLDLCIPLRKITVTEEGTQFGEYIPSQAAVVMVYFVGNYASYEYAPRIEDNKLFITDNGELKPGVYAIDVRIQEPERKLRSFRCGELEIVRETRQLALGDFVLDNNITLDADAFIFGEGPSAFEVAVRDGYTGTKAEWLESLRGKEGRGIADIVSLPTGAFRILLTDGSAYVTPILKGEQGVSIVDFTVSSITSQLVLCTITMSDGTTRTVNLPRGEKGEQGDAGEDGRGIQSVVMNNDYTITFSYTDGTSYTTPQALRGEKGENGQDGQDGQDGRGVSSMSLDDDNHLTVSYTDGTTFTTPQSLQGERGVSITDFEQVGENATMCFFNIFYSNGNISQIGLPKGEQGDRGEPGPQGVKGDTVVLGEVGEYKLYNVGGTATDGAMTQDATTKAIAANTGYYECGTAAGTAAKVAVGDNEALYTLQKGGSIKVKMTNANAAASGVTLKIGSAAATPLYYNNEPVSASNTWEAGEVISVYYDGSNYQASNSQGSGKAADMKYDNSLSGLAADNVQAGLDEVVDAINDVQTSEERTESYNLEGYTASNHKTFRMRYNCGTHGRATVSFTAPSNFVLKIFCLSSFNAVNNTIDSSNIITNVNNITPGVTESITWDDSRAKYVVLSMGNTSATALSESAVNTFKSSVNLVIEDLFGYDGLGKMVTDLETKVGELDSLSNSLSGDVDVLETNVSEINNQIRETVTIPASIRKSDKWINGNLEWADRTGTEFTLFEASEGDVFYGLGNNNEVTQFAWLTEYTGTPSGTAAPLVGGTAIFFLRKGEEGKFTAPANTKYLYMLYKISADRDATPIQFQVVRGGNAPKQESSELYYNGEKINIGNRMASTYLQALTDDMSGSTEAWVEGFAVINGYAAVTRLKGYISLYKLDDEKFYYLSCTKVSAFDSNNAANWGVEKYDSDDVLPLLYVTNQKAKTAYVFRVQTNGTCTLVQTITTSNLPSVYCGGWAIDKERGKIILYTASIDNPESGDLETTHKAKHRVIVWPIPALRNENEEIVSSVVLNYNEAEEAYVMEDQPNNNTGYDDTVGYVDSEGYYTWVYQGIVAKNGKLIIPCGGWSEKRRRMLRVWDMDERRQINCIDLTHIIYDKHPLWETEDCDIVDGSVYMFYRGLSANQSTLQENIYAHVFKFDFD